jgi:hypothetical protein
MPTPRPPVGGSEKVRAKGSVLEGIQVGCRTGRFRKEFHHGKRTG